MGFVTEFATCENMDSRTETDPRTASAAEECTNTDKLVCPSISKMDATTEMQVKKEITYKLVSPIKRDASEEMQLKPDPDSEESTTTDQPVDSYQNNIGPPFKCLQPGCDKTYNSKSGLVHHEKKNHCPDPEEYFCYVCSRGFLFKSKLRRHLLTHKPTEEKKTYPCPYDGCTKSFFQKYNLVPHIASFHEGKRVKCTYPGCNRVFNQKVGLQYHLATTHEEEEDNKNGNIICNECGKTFKDEENLQQHETAFHKVSEIYACGKCSRKFTLHSQLLKHAKYHEKSVEKSDLYCKLCNVQFKTKAFFLKHKKKHDDEPESVNCICNICCAKVKGMSNFGKHLSKHIDEISKHKDNYQKNTQDELFTCDTCKRGFKIKSKLRRHMAVHLKPSKRRVFPCPVRDCLKQYFTKWNLDYHLKFNHTEEEVTESKNKNSAKKSLGKDGASSKDAKITKEDTEMTNDPIFKLVKRLKERKQKELQLQSDERDMSVSDVTKSKKKKKRKTKEKQMNGISPVLDSAIKRHKKKRSKETYNKNRKGSKNERKKRQTDEDNYFTSYQDDDMTVGLTGYSYALAELCEVMHNEVVIKEELESQSPKQQETNRLDESSQRLVIVANRKYVSRRNNLEDNEKKRNEPVSLELQKDSDQEETIEEFCNIGSLNTSIEDVEDNENVSLEVQKESDQVEKTEESRKVEKTEDFRNVESLNVSIDDLVSPTVTNEPSLSIDCFLKSQNSGEKTLPADKRQKTHYVQIYSYTFHTDLQEWLCLMLKAMEEEIPAVKFSGT